MDKKSIKEQPNTIRPPIVTVMGHVDHGKTSILDAIRKTNLAAKEYGGITQHIGAYQVTYQGKKITFIDTPGHAAFSQMRSRGGKAADIVILVVAADEGVMPQTKEAISHAKAAGVPIIVAINKVDTAGSNPQKIKQELASADVLVEDWGGEILSIEVSAKTLKGIDKLLEAILAVAEVKKISGDSKGELEATIIESGVDRLRGVTVSCIIRNGSLKVGQEVTASGLAAKIKSLVNENYQSVAVAIPGDPIEILGFSQVPDVGDLILNKGSDLAELSKELNKVEIVGKNSKKTISVILKADTQGTLQAVKASLSQIVTESAEATYSLKFLHSAPGNINESDVMLAQSTNGIVFGFNVKIPANVESLADTYKIRVRTYKTIYELIDDAKEILEGTAATAEAKIKGRAIVQKIFKLPSGDIIAGSKVVAGALKENSRISVYDKDPVDVTKDDIPLYTGQIKKLKKGKDEVNVVGKDIECGILLKPQYEEIKEGLWIEVR